MPENVLETVQKFLGISQRLDILWDSFHRFEQASHTRADSLDERLRSVEGKVIALETSVSSLRETVRETVRDTIRVQIAEERARQAEERAGRQPPALEEG